MLNYYLRNCVRLIIVSGTQPKAGLAFFMKNAGHLPFFHYSVKRDNDSLYKRKVYLRNKKKNVGHAIKGKTVSLSFSKWKLFKCALEEGGDLTAEHFYLNRSVKDVEYLLKMTSKHVNIKGSSLIFDPGCGTGRHLFYLVDKYDCRGIGVDVYPPAVAIAKKANLGKRIRFYNCSSLESGVLDKIIPEGCDFVLMNSWLSHVYKYDGYDEFVKKILKSCRYILFIGSAKKYTLEELLDDPMVIMEKAQDGTRYGLIKGDV